MARFVSFFIVIFLLFTKNSFSIPPMDGSEYLKRCRKFTVPLPSLRNLQNVPTVIAECGVGLNKVMVIQNPFFPFMERTENLMPLLIAEIKSSIDKRIASGECSDALDYFTKRLEMIKEPYKEDRLPSEAEEFDRMGIAEIEKILGTESIQQALKEKSKPGNDYFLKRFIMLCTRYVAFFDNWTTAEELVR